MHTKFRMIAAVLAVAAIAGCSETGTSSTPMGDGSAGTEQLRSSLTPMLRSAGIPDSCIAQLSTPTLSQLQGMSRAPSNSSLGTLDKRQTIRDTVATDCPGI